MKEMHAREMRGETRGDTERSGNTKFSTDRNKTNKTKTRGKQTNTKTNASKRRETAEPKTSFGSRWPERDDTARVEMRE